MRYVTIPTYGRETTAPLIEVCQRVAEVVIVHTAPDPILYEGTVAVDGSGSRSIQRWWNIGLDRCDGPTLVLNDDITVTTASLEHLFDELDNADIVYLAGHRVGHRTPLTGWCYGIHPDRIRPDEAFGWWAGDDDLYLRAVAQGMKITAVDEPDIRHVRSNISFESPTHAEMAIHDMGLLHERWG